VERKTKVYLNPSQDTDVSWCSVHDGTLGLCDIDKTISQDFLDNDY